MNVTRNLPIGIQSFEDLRKKDFLYIDKTDCIFQLAHTNKVYFLSRPRRFGKSLLLSTLKAYFLGQKELFNGLAIDKLENADAGKRELWQKYPVLYLDFNGANYETREALEGLLHNQLCSWEYLYGKSASENTLAERFKGIITRAYQKTGKQTVVLVDEYDKPLLETMNTDEALNETYRRILKGFYGVFKSCDQYLRFVFLTGVTKFSKVSIFSDLNNLRDISLDSDYAALCGITQQELEANFRPEIQTLAETQHLSGEQTLAQLKQRYDGYHFSESAVNVYNPFSLLSVFAGKAFRDYWFATGTLTFLVQLLQEQTGNIRDILEGAEMTENALQDYRPDLQNPLPILFQAGYLTIKGYDPEFRLYKLGFPNDEVKYGFLDNLIPAYTSIAKDNSGLFIGNFVRDLQKRKIDSFMERMYTACAGLPYSLASKENVKMRERDYQIAFYLIFTLMGQFAQTEVQSYHRTATDGGGSQKQRCFGTTETRSQHYTRMYSVDVGSDCVVFTADTIYIFEFKLMGSGTAQEALEQIKKNGYFEPYKTFGKKIILIGAAFRDGIDEDTPDTWIAETL